MIERVIPLNEFPSPTELWERYKRYKEIDDPEVERIITQEFYEYQDGKTASLLSNGGDK